MATLDTQRRVLITSAGNDSGINFTVYGAGDAGVAITETLAGGNGVAVATQQDYLTITRVAGSGAVATTVEVGTNAIGSTRWVVPDMVVDPPDIGIQLDLVSGAATFSVETTLNDVKAPIPIYQDGFSQAMPVPTAFAWPGLGALVAGAQGIINGPISGWRLTVTAGQGLVRATGIQSGLAGG